MVADGLKFRRSTAHAGDGGDIDDLSAALGDHEFSGGLGKKKSARQIRLYHFVPVFEAHFFDWSTPRSTGVVDKNIDATELRNRRIDYGFDVGGFFYVAAQCQRPYP